MKVRNCKFEEDPFSKNVQGVGKIYHEILLSMKVLHTKPQIKNVKIIQIDFYYTVKKNRMTKKL